MERLYRLHSRKYRDDGSVEIIINHLRMPILEAVRCIDQLRRYHEWSTELCDYWLVPEPASGIDFPDDCACQGLGCFFDPRCPYQVRQRQLTFDALRRANIARVPQFKNALGGPAHSESDGSDWSPAQWLQAAVGELGEYANVRKKFERGDLTRDEFTALARLELADVVTYLDILAFRLGIDLGQAVRDKFNLVSERVGASVRL